MAPNPFIGRPGRKGRKQVRVSHQDLPKDAFIQKYLGNKIQQQLAAFRPPTTEPALEETNRPLLIPLGLYWNGQREDNATVATLAMRRSQEQSGYTGPNIQGCIFSNQQPGTIPLLLFWHQQRQDNATVATPEMIQSQKDSGYGNPAIQGYIYPADRCK